MVIIMKKPEILSPAGNFESLKAAIIAGCDAVYLGGKCFGARFFAQNFSDEEIINSIKYAHLYGVKVYVTVNTLIYENEVNQFLDYIDFLYKNNVDALIIQDIGMMDLLRKTYPLLELHASTQMHIHNIEGVKLVEKSGLKRAVLARETNIDTIKYIKENTNIELEIFVHGALCISYSGQCLMSSLIGGRSGNRGACAGSCRLKYSLVNDKKSINDKYLLSTKDLNSLENIGKLIDIGVDSLKIEGRMKSPSYVYMVTKLYRKAVDSYIESGKVYIDEIDLNNLKKIFNREFTKGFLFNIDNNDLINDFRPNHLGIEIGKVINIKNGFINIKLTDELNIQDGIRIISNKDIGFTISAMFKNHKKIDHAYKNDNVSIPLKEAVKINDKVVKTTDYLLNKEINNLLKENTKKIKINVILEAKINEPLKLILDDYKNRIEIEGNKVYKAINSPLSYARLKEQISKFGNSIYEINNLNIDMDDNIFISIKEINDLRNKGITLLNDKRLYKLPYKKEKYIVELKSYPLEKDYNILINDIKFYEKIKNYNFKNIYTVDKIDDNREILKLERVINSYLQNLGKMLVGELGSVNKYKNVITDFSLNVTNSYSIAFLHSLGVLKVTLSYELDLNQVKDIIGSYHERYNKHPNLEVIIFGKEEAMISKFNLNKYTNMDDTYLKDRFNNLYPIIIKNDLMHIYNYKTKDINNYDDYFNIGINSLRFNIADEDDLNKFINKKLKI